MKNIFKSKTFWLNILAIIVDIIMKSNLPTGEVSAPDPGLTTLAGLNVLTRLFTRQAVKIPGV